MADELGEAYVLVTPRLDRKGFDKAGRGAADAAGEGITQGSKGLFARAKGAGSSITQGMAAGIGIGLTQDIGRVAGALVGEIVSMGASLEREKNKVGRVFGEMLGDVEAWAAGSASAMGLTNHEAAVMAAGIQDLVVPMGFSRDAATDLTLEVADLAGALAEWDTQGRSSSEVGEILAKALLGERDALVSLGVKISEADVQNRLLEMGMKDATGSALEQARATATLALLQEKSVDAVNSYEEGTNGVTRAQNEARAAMQTAKEELATALQPAILAATTAGAELAKIVGSLTTFLIENKEAVAIVAGAYATFKGAQGIGGLITKFRSAEGANGSFTKGLKSSIKSSINPSALAFAGVAVAVGLLIKRWADAKAARKEFNKDAGTVAGALTTEDGLVVSLAGSWGTLDEAQRGAADAIAAYLEEDSRFKDRNQLDDLERLGLSFDDLGEAIHGGADSFVDFLERGVAAGEFSIANEGVMDGLVAAYAEGPNALGEFIDSLGMMGVGLDGNTDLIRSFAREQDVAIEGLRNATKGAITNAEANGVLTAAQADAQRATVDQSESLAELTGIHNTLTESTAAADNIVDGWMHGMIDAGDAVEDLTEDEADLEAQTEDTRTEIEKLADGANDLEEAVDHARTAIDNLTGGQVSLDDATIDLHASFDELAGQLADTSGEWDVTTEAGRDNMTQARDTAGAIRDYELALIESGTSAAEARTQADFLRLSLAAQLDQAGLTALEVDELIATYGEVPDSVYTAMQADTGLAHFAALNYRNALNSIPGRIVTRAEIDYALYDPGRHGGGAGRIFERAHGGNVAAGGPTLVGEHGPELLRLPAGAGVTPHTRTRQQTDAAPSPGVRIGELHINLDAAVDLSDPSSARRFARDLRDELVRLEDETA